MKAQMKFQKLLSLISLIIGALVFVYALCFFSGNLSDLLMYKDDNLYGGRGQGYYVAEDFLSYAQTFVILLIVLGIIYILAAAFLYITDTNKRRNYYTTNYVAVFIMIGVAALVGIFLIAYESLLLVQFANVDWEGVETVRGRVSNLPEVSQSTVMFLLGYIVAVIVIANAVVWALTLVWKRKLMQGEKALLERGKLTEVAQ